MSEFFKAIGYKPKKLYNITFCDCQKPMFIPIDTELTISNYHCYQCNVEKSINTKDLETKEVFPTLLGDTDAARANRELLEEVILNYELTNDFIVARTENIWRYYLEVYVGEGETRAEALEALSLQIKDEIKDACLNETGWRY